MPMYRSIEEATTHNTKLTCNARGCHLQRSGVSNYCGTHHARYRKYGSANSGRRIRSKEYAQERAECLEVIKANAAHPGIIEGIARMDTWLKACQEGDRRYPAVTDMNRLASRGVTGLQVLVEMSGMWLYASRNARTLPDGRTLDFALGVSLFFMVKLDARMKDGKRNGAFKPTSMNRRMAGEFVRGSIGVLCDHIARNVEAKAEAAKEKVKAFHAPLN